MPEIGEIQVWNGWVWNRLSPTTPVDLETYGMPKPLKWVPADHGGPEDDLAVCELCELLLCPDCDMELGSTPCGPRHAYLADNPMEHQLLAPLLVSYLRQMRFETGRLCETCSGVLGHDVVLATGECNHVYVRGDQALMSRTQWQALVEETVGTRAALAGLEDRLTDYEEKLEEIVLTKKLKMETT